MTTDVGGARTVHVAQGEQHISRNPNIVLTTILGSCVAACMCDREAGVGGMNHFVLPGNEQGGDDSSTGIDRYGVHAMELLMTKLIKAGARRERLEVKLFGGATIQMACQINLIGTRNARFAQRFVKDEGLTLRAMSLGGEFGRRIQYRPVSGKARQILILDTNKLEKPSKMATPSPESGELELF